MKKIKLTQGKSVVIDDEDYDSVSNRKWYAIKAGNSFYAVHHKSSKEKLTLMHRLILSPPRGFIVDHINGDGLDNRRSNLRVCTNSENTRNRRKVQNASSKYFGVYWNKRAGQWLALRYYKNKLRYLGYFVKEEDGARAYNESFNKWPDKFCRLNKV